MPTRKLKQLLPYHVPVRFQLRKLGCTCSSFNVGGRITSERSKLKVGADRPYHDHEAESDVDRWLRAQVRLGASRGQVGLRTINVRLLLATNNIKQD